MGRLSEKTHAQIAAEIEEEFAFLLKPGEKLDLSAAFDEDDDDYISPVYDPRRGRYLTTAWAKFGLPD